MKKIIFILNCILNISFITAGFTGDTLVRISEKQFVPLKSFKIGDKLLCFDGKGISEQSIDLFEARKVDECFKVTTHGGDVIYSSKDARFLMPKEKQWNYASDLRPGNWLMYQNMEGIKVKQIENQIAAYPFWNYSI